MDRGDDEATRPFEDTVQLTEVSLRDGLQDLPLWVDTATKASLVSAYQRAGLQQIEVTSFVRPDRVPQLADADELSALVRPDQHPSYSALVPNQRGLRRALEAGYHRVTVVLSATDGHNVANLGSDLASWLPRVEALIGAAKERQVHVRAAISVAFGCPFDGPVAPADVVRLASRLHRAGADEISLADTVGVADPAAISGLSRRVAETVGAAPSLHLHGSADRVAGNVTAGVAAGVRHFDAALTGIGGCPYAPGAPGNLATERLVALLGNRVALTPTHTAAAAEELRRALARGKPLDRNAPTAGPAEARR